MSKATPQRPLLFRWWRRQDSRISAAHPDVTAFFSLQKQQKQRKKQNADPGIEVTEPAR